MKKLSVSSIFLVILLITIWLSDTIAQQLSNNVVLRSNVEWTYLNPARKEKAPMAGTLWGDRNTTEATGFLLKPADGFKSPPHIHNVSYRGIVIKGLIHNDDPNAVNTWMPPGSFWTQPKGEIHITASMGKETLAYIEIENGPYLVNPSENAFDSGERPINVDKSNIVWLDASEVKWIDYKDGSNSKSKPQVAFLWKKNIEQNMYGTFIKLSKGFDGDIISHGSTFGAVVIKGLPTYSFSEETDWKVLEPGSYFSSSKKSVHHILSKSDEEIIIYVRTNDYYQIINRHSEK